MPNEIIFFAKLHIFSTVNKYLAYKLNSDNMSYSVVIVYLKTQRALSTIKSTI